MGLRGGYDDWRGAGEVDEDGCGDAIGVGDAGCVEAVIQVVASVAGATYDGTEHLECGDGFPACEALPFSEDEFQSPRGGPAPHAAIVCGIGAAVAKDSDDEHFVGDHADGYEFLKQNVRADCWAFRAGK